MNIGRLLFTGAARCLALSLVALAAACTTPAYIIQQPADATTVACAPPTGTGPCQVRAQVAWKGVSVHPTPDLSLDGAPVVNALTVPPSGNFVEGTLPMSPGSHKIDIAGLLSDGVSIQTYTATSAFTVSPRPTPVGGVAIQAPTMPPLLERTKSATVTVTIVRTPPFTGPVSVSFAASPPASGLTAASASIAAGATSAPLTFSASGVATLGNVSGTLTASGLGIMAVPRTVSLRVGRTTGAFSEAGPTPYSSTLPSTATSVSGTYKVQIATGAPGLPQPRKATFFKGTTQLGSDIGFTLGPVSTLGGAGFCRDAQGLTPGRGVVLSGALPGFSSQNVFTFVDLDGAAHAMHEVPADMQSSAGTPHVFQPRVYFSPDCSVAMVVGVSTLGPLKNVLHLIDLTTGSSLGSELNFDTNIYSATLTTVGSAQRVVVVTDTGTATAQTMNANVP
jgi:hypothetical protein